MKGSENPASRAPLIREARGEQLSGVGRESKMEKCTCSWYGWVLSLLIRLIETPGTLIFVALRSCCWFGDLLRFTLSQEAERKTRGRIKLLQKRQGRQELVVIVGRGTHSEDGVSRLQPAIMTLLEESQGGTSYQNVPVPLLTFTFLTLFKHCQLDYQNWVCGKMLMLNHIYKTPGTIWIVPQFTPRVDSNNPGRIRVSFDGRSSITSSDIGVPEAPKQEEDSSWCGWVLKCIFGWPRGYVLAMIDNIIFIFLVWIYILDHIKHHITQYRSQ